MARRTAALKKEQPMNDLKTAEDKNALAARNEEVEALLDQTLGLGTTQRAEDNLVPLVYVLQSNSPQVNKRNDAYIEGAEAGDIWLRHSPKPIIKGTEGISFIPCFHDRDYVEWIPRDAGGGFVGRHRELPKECKVIRDQGRKIVNRMPNGNELVDTISFAGIALLPDGRPLPYIIPMKSTNLTVARGWNGLINQKLKNGKVLAAFSHSYRLKTEHRKNKDGEWFVYHVEDEAKVNDPEILKMGWALQQAMEKGQKQAEAEVHTGATIDNDDKATF